MAAISHGSRLTWYPGQLIQKTTPVYKNRLTTAYIRFRKYVPMVIMESVKSRFEENILR